MNLPRPTVLFTLVVSFGLCVASSAGAPKTVKVDFDSTATYKDSYGTTHTAQQSLLLADSRAAIIAKAQEKFDASLGANQIAISEGTGGDINIIMSRERYGWYGNVGAANGPAVVDTEVFRLMESAPGVFAFPAGAPFRNAVGETLAHEIAHRLGAGHNQTTNPYRLMTDGKLVPPEGRTPGTRQFITRDVTVMTKNLPLLNAMPKEDAFAQAAPAGGEGEASAAPQMLGDGGLCIDAHLSFTGPGSAEFGYLSASDEFAYQASDGESGATMTIHRTGPIDFAVKMSSGGPMYLSSGPFFQYELSDPNPFFTDGSGYQTLIGTFITPDGTASFRLDATIEPELGAFVSFVPEPHGLLSIVLSGVMLLRRR